MVGEAGVTTAAGGVVVATAAAGDMVGGTAAVRWAAGRVAAVSTVRSTCRRETSKWAKNGHLRLRLK